MPFQKLTDLFPSPERPKHLGIFYWAAKQHQEAFSRLETKLRQKRRQLARVSDDERDFSQGGMFHGITNQRRSQPLSLMIGMNEDIPKRSPKNKIGQDSTKCNEFSVMSGRKADARSCKHTLDLIQGSASSPPGETVKVLKFVCLYRQFAVVKKGPFLQRHPTLFHFTPTGSPLQAKDIPPRMRRRSPPRASALTES